jgi:hypothetical protein
MAKKSEQLGLNEDPSVIALEFYNKTEGGAKISDGYKIGAGAEPGTDANHVQAGLVDGTYVKFLNDYKSGNGCVAVVKRATGKSGNRYRSM